MCGESAGSESANAVEHRIGTLGPPKRLKLSVVNGDDLDDRELRRCCGRRRKDLFCSELTMSPRFLGHSLGFDMIYDSPSPSFVTHKNGFRPIPVFHSGQPRIRSIEVRDVHPLQQFS